MHFTTHLMFAIAAQIASGAALTEQWGCAKGQVKYSHYQNANFDNLSGLPLLPALTKVGTYKQIYYQAFNLVQVIKTNLAPGVLPHSGQNYAATGPVEQTTAGTPMMTLNYQNADPNAKTFDMSSFYYGCVVTLANSATALPAACTIVFTGYKGNDNTVADSTQVCSATFIYNPTSTTGVQQMAFTGTSRLSYCKDLTHGTFTFQPVGGAAVTASDLALTVDDVVYTVNGCKKD